MTPPEYRVRLFLSVDLTGSTAFKHKSQNALEWIKAFRIFYEQFPILLRSNYLDITQHEHRNLSKVEKDNGYPRLWKTVGDEILFCCTVSSLCQLGVCIDAFVKTLIDYGKIASGDGLNTKGNAWVASFPTPNCSIKPIKISDIKSRHTQKKNNHSLPTEDIELSIDEDPSNFDFLGKGIDAGFRISKNSAINTLTISPGLGILLCECKNLGRMSKFNTSMRLTEMQEFKGVANNHPYPVLTIDTYRDDKYKEIINQQRELLGEPQLQDIDNLESYLRNYLSYFGIEIPSVKQRADDQEFSPPAFYTEYKKKWLEEHKKIVQENHQLDDSSKVKDNAIPTSVDANQSLKEAEELIPFWTNSVFRQIK